MNSARRDRNVMTAALRGLDRRLRSIAYDILCCRDGLSGWRAKRNEFRETVRKDPEQLRRDVERKLRNILVHAHETSPYYRSTWTALGLNPVTDFTFEDLTRYPFLTKEIIGLHKTSLVSERFPRGKLDLSYTGGTTGTHTSFYRNHECTVSRFGRQWGILECCGYRPGMRRALVWGVHADLAEEPVHPSLKYRFREFGSAQETLPCTVIRDKAMLAYHARLKRFDPEVLYGYPNAIVELGEFIHRMGLSPVRVRKILTTAERLTDAQRKLLELRFGGEVINLYCTREYGSVGFECERHDGFHVDTESVFIEIICDGRRVQPGESGEITITDLLNYGMPLIRSRTGDRGLLSTEPCPCGSPLPLLKGLDGRVTDLIYRRDGSVVAGVMLVDLFMEIPTIERAQFVQERIGEMEINLVVTTDFSNEQEQLALREVRDLVGSDMTVHIRRVPDIARNPRSGKFQEVICKVA